MVHGLLVWGLATVASLYVAGSVTGSVVGKVTGVVGSVVGTVASGAAAGATAIAPEMLQAAKGQLAESGVSWDSIKREAQTLLAQTGKPALQPGALEQRGKEAVADARSTATQAAVTPTTAERRMEFAA